MTVKVGVTCSFNYAKRYFFLPVAYFRAVERAGGLPLIIPGMCSPSLADDLLKGLDALLLTGGGDIDSALFQEEPHCSQGETDPLRDVLEIALVRAAIKQNLPTLCICRGAQILNVACGGTLYQDLPSQGASTIQHLQHTPRRFATHNISIEEGTLLASIFRAKKTRVNSVHHQGIKAVAHGLKVSARAPDGVIEGIEHPASSFMLGVQWHPETMDDEPLEYELFNSLISAGRLL